MKILITGGSGFIGVNFIDYILNKTQHSIINIDKLSYASNNLYLTKYKKNKNYSFHKSNICNSKLIKKIIFANQPDVVMHMAAETHVDNSIKKPKDFIYSNLIGTFVMLKNSLEYWNQLENKKKKNFLFHHISTDEVYGDLGKKKKKFNEKSPYLPSSPYSASKAGSDHLVRAWGRTYKLPYIITNSSNNYGPFQNKEKFIPLIINNAINDKIIPIYGRGNQVRDWIFVEDHVKALLKVLTVGKIFETYNIGGQKEISNLELVYLIFKILDKLNLKKEKNLKDLIKFVRDRPGHDYRYVINSSKIYKKLKWMPKKDLQKGLEKTIKWYLNNN